MTKRALITGITGMVGSHLLDYLLKHTDWEIHGMLRWRSPLDNISGHLDDINAGGRIKLHYADLRDTMAMRLVRGVRSRPARKTADQRGMHVSPRVALRDLESRHRSCRPLLCRSLQHVRDDDAYVHSHWPAPRRRLRRIHFRQANRDDRGQQAAAGGEGRKSRFAAHLGGRPRRRARLSYAGDHQPDAGRLLQYRRTVYLHGAGHA